MMDAAAEGSRLNQEHGRASEFVLSSTTKPFAAAVDGNADSHQRSTTNFNATSKDAAAVASLPSGVASSVTNVSGGPRRGQISLHFDPRGLASQGSLEDFDPVDAFVSSRSRWFGCCVFLLRTSFRISLEGTAQAEADGPEGASEG